MARRAVLVMVVAATLVGAAPAPAAAGGVKIVIGGAPFRGHVRKPFGHAPKQIHPRRHFGLPHRVWVGPRRCHYPGYWTYQWIPQTHSSWVWVPSHYNSDALWVEGHWTLHTVQSGFWQPVWVPDRWMYC